MAEGRQLKPLVYVEPSNSLADVVKTLLGKHCSMAPVLGGDPRGEWQKERREGREEGEGWDGVWGCRAQKKKRGHVGSALRSRGVALLSGTHGMWPGRRAGGGWRCCPCVLQLA